MGSAIGGGVAGVASTVDADSIMVCGDHTNYHEWEFIYDPSKWKPPSNPNTKLGGTPAGNSNTASGMNTGSMGSPIGTPIGTPIGGGPGATQAGPGGGPGIGSIGGTGNAVQNMGMQPQGQGGMPGQQGSFGSVCGMEARPGAR